MKNYSICKCGAVTIYFANGATNSVKKENITRFNIDLTNVERLSNTYCCNHCANRWGIDICECGSGEDFETCECGCGKPHDILGEEFDSFGALLKIYR